MRRSICIPASSLKKCAVGSTNCLRNTSVASSRYECDADTAPGKRSLTDAIRDELMLAVFRDEARTRDARRSRGGLEFFPAASSTHRAPFPAEGDIQGYRHPRG